MTDAPGIYPPKWHPDPFARHAYRWYDGAKWTEHVSDDGVKATDPPVSHGVYNRATPEILREPAADNSVGTGPSLYDPRVAGLPTAVVVALSVFLPWFSLSGPLVGTITVSGIHHGADGWVTLLLAVVLAILAWTRRRLGTPIMAGVIGVGYILEYANGSADVSAAKSDAARGGGEFGAAIIKAISVSPGIGLILGCLLALACAGWLFITRKQRLPTDTW